MLAIALIGFAILALRMWALGLGLPSWLHPHEYRVLFCSTSTAAISIRFFYLSDIPLLSAGPGLSSLFPVAEYFRATAQLRFSYRDESIIARYRPPASRSLSVADLRLERFGPRRRGNRACPGRYKALAGRGKRGRIKALVAGRKYSL